jgi:hypothetical protein
MSIWLALLLVANIAIISILVYAGVKIKGILDKTTMILKTFFTPPDEKTPSEFALTTQAIADQLGRSLVAQLKSTFMTAQSNQVRAQNAVNGDIAEDLVNQANPLIGAIMNTFPALRKTIRRNPGLADMAIQTLLSKIGSGTIATGNNHKPDVSQVKFDL